MIGQLETYIQAGGDNMVMFVIGAQKKCKEEGKRCDGWFVVPVSGG